MRCSIALLRPRPRFNLQYSPIANRCAAVGCNSFSGDCVHARDYGICNGTASPEFEAATIKPVKEPDPNRMNDRTDGRRYTTRNTTLRDLILMAYGVDRQQTAGGPAWIATDEYDVDAVGDGIGKQDSNQMVWQDDATGAAGGPLQAHLPLGAEGDLFLRAGRCKGRAEAEGGRCERQARLWMQRLGDMRLPGRLATAFCTMDGVCRAGQAGGGQDRAGGQSSISHCNGLPTRPSSPAWASMCLRRWTIPMRRRDFLPRSRSSSG